jgi:hypothetical protein
MNTATLRVEAAHHVLDDAVLPGGIHALQHHKQRPLAVSVKALLQPGETLDILCEHCVGRVIVEHEAAGIGRIDQCKMEALGLVDAKLLHQALGFQCWAVRSW